MTRTALKARAKASPEPAAPVAPPAADAEFQAECEALSAAVAENLEAVLRPGAKPPAGKQATAGPSPDNEPKPVQYPGEMEFVPAYSAIMKHARVGAKTAGGTDEVTVSRDLLEFLLRCVLDGMEFDEQQYQKCNPDVAAAIKTKKMHSGREHFIKTGYFEGRSGGVRVDEAWYLARNPDVAAAKKAGKFDSAASQYRLSGAAEWRLPNQQSEDSIRMWKSVLGR